MTRNNFTTKEEVQEMIDDAIRKHNRNASIISMCVGWVVLALFAEGLLRLIGVIEPIFPWMEISLKWLVRNGFTCYNIQVIDGV